MDGRLIPDWWSGGNSWYCADWGNEPADPRQQKWMNHWSPTDREDGTADTVVMRDKSPRPRLMERREHMYYIWLIGWMETSDPRLIEWMEQLILCSGGDEPADPRLKERMNRWSPTLGVDGSDDLWLIEWMEMADPRLVKWMEQLIFCRWSG